MIGLMDCNNFFVSCERLFRPDLAKRPVAVLSSNDGCIVSRSKEVKDIGIPMGIPYFEVKKTCEKEGITLFSSNFPLYRDISGRVMDALRAELGRCEVYSIDEAFFEVSDQVQEADILEIRARIMQKTGIPVSFGVGNTKTIAKASSEIAKKGNGVCIMDMAHWENISPTISCGSIWGIGRQTTMKLRNQGVYTVAELVAAGPSFLKNLLGVLGERLYFELTGQSAYIFGEGNDTEHQSLSSTRSFAQPTTKRAVLESAVGYHVAHLGEKLREHGWTASRITIIAAPSRFGDYAYRDKSAAGEISPPTSDTAVILKHALTLLGELFDPAVPYKKAGVILQGISPESFTSPSLFESPNTKSGIVYHVVDSLNTKFGNNAVHSGVIFDTEKWQESRKLISPQYTTQWSEIRSVRAT